MPDRISRLVGSARRPRRGSCDVDALPQHPPGHRAEHRAGVEVAQPEPGGDAARRCWTCPTRTVPSTATTRSAGRSAACHGAGQPTGGSTQPRDSREPSRCSARASVDDQLDQADRAAGVVVDVDVLDVDARLARRRRTAGPARRGGRARRRRPTRVGARRAAVLARDRAGAGDARGQQLAEHGRGRRRSRRRCSDVELARGPRASRPCSAPALAVTICCHSAGSPAATRVTSRTPWPGQREVARRAPRRAGRRPATASRCGRCEVRATAWSCSSGVTRPATAPQTAASASTSATAPAGEPACGRDRPRPAVEQRGAGGQRAGPLAAGHRVAADVAAQRRRRACARRPRSGLGLDAADVGDHGVACGAAPRRSRRRGGRAGPRPRPAAAGRRRRRRGRRPSPEAVRTCSAVDVASAAPRCPARRQARPIEVPSSPAPTTSTGPGQPASLIVGDLAGRGSGPCAARPRRAGRQWVISARGRSVSTWAIIRTTRGIEPSISSSRAQISGTSPNPSGGRRTPGTPRPGRRWR